jgi:hopanoid-associated phosphorylase
VTFIAIICGLKSEAAAVRDALSAADVAPDKFRIGVSGADAARAEDLARRSCNAGAIAVMSVGVSGGLDPMLVPGDLVIGEKVISDNDGRHYEADLYLMRALGKAMPKGARNAALFGADSIIADASHKSALFKNHGCVAVDMESHGAARAAGEAGVPFLAIRAIADPADRALPKAALGAVSADGSTKIFATLFECVKRPGDFPKLVQLGRDSEAALKTLRRDLGGLFLALLLSLDF